MGIIKNKNQLVIQKNMIEKREIHFIATIINLLYQYI
jgi:hypothetical protein